jgi:hypothetical protein
MAARDECVHIGLIRRKYLPIFVNGIRRWVQASRTGRGRLNGSFAPCTAGRCCHYLDGPQRRIGRVRQPSSRSMHRVQGSHHLGRHHLTRNEHEGPAGPDVLEHDVNDRICSMSAPGPDEYGLTL